MTGSLVPDFGMKRTRPEDLVSILQVGVEREGRLTSVVGRGSHVSRSKRSECVAECQGTACVEDLSLNEHSQYLNLDLETS